MLGTSACEWFCVCAGGVHVATIIKDHMLMVLKLIENTCNKDSSLRYLILSRPGPYFIKVKIILSFRFKINLIFI